MSQHDKTNRDAHEKTDAPVDPPHPEPDLPPPDFGTEIYAATLRDEYREPPLPDPEHGEEEE
jgi:hypothetical protein